MAQSPKTVSLYVEKFDYKNIFLMSLFLKSCKKKKKPKAGKTFGTCITHKLQIFSIYDEFLKINKKTTHNPGEKWTKYVNRYHIELNNS